MIVSVPRYDEFIVVCVDGFCWCCCWCCIGKSLIVNILTYNSLLMN